MTTAELELDYHKIHFLLLPLLIRINLFLWLIFCYTPISIELWKKN